MDVEKEGERLLARKYREIEAGARACRERAVKAREADYAALSADSEAVNGVSFGTGNLRAPFPAGMVLSDGVSQRIRNRSAGKIGLTYRVLAHA